MGKVIGRITGAADRPRGPDAQIALSVPEDWIRAGATLEIELPRNLSCAGCSGGGCDACERSGAVSLRGRKEPAELVEITLPRGPAVEDVPSSRNRAIVVRIPERGGLPAEGSGLPRGNLLLSVRAGALPEKGVARLPGPSIPAPPIVPEILQGGPSPPSALTAPRRRWVALLLAAAAAAVVAWLLR